MLELIRWILGYIDFEFSGGFIDGFINACYKNHIPVHDLKRSDGSLFGGTTAKNYKKLHTIALKNGGRVKIVKKHGFVFTLLRFKHRFGLIAGALAFVLIINFLNGFVWNIEIVGNSRISDESIIQFLSENDLKVGSYWDNVKRNTIEALIMASFDDCAWVNINEDGTTARVEINETIEKPTLTEKTVTNFKATKDGIIVSSLVYDGWQVAKVGDAVTEGDLLISGVYGNELKKATIYAHASGEVIARVDEKVNITISRQQGIKEYLDTKTFKTLEFFGVKIPLYIGSSNITSSDVKASTKYLALNKKPLPIGIKTKTVKPYIKTTTTLSDKELNALCEKELKSKIKNEFGAISVVKKDVDISLNSENGVVKGTVTCLESIGKEVKIKGVQKYIYK